LIDCAKLFVVVDAASMPPQYDRDNPVSGKSKMIVEVVRRAASLHMGLASNIQDAGQRRSIPKIVLLTPSLTTDPAGELADVKATAFSVGELHPTIQLTRAICLSAALSIPHTVASNC
jgi:2-methylaconitate cis-trans-isomerase PrpF